MYFTFEIHINLFITYYGLNFLHIPTGSKHQSHQDYMEKADKARRERLSSGRPAPK